MLVLGKAVLTTMLIYIMMALDLPGPGVND
jgi:hypothetical protein